ncbi:protein amalgam-like isoform X2 [Macrobrachium nipponense]|uniref:protein amalgam-like isoform X2 n=1 Tax=Macrobrachium nipponense TaxID=159736 RepID=UPI0030C8543E
MRISVETISAVGGIRKSRITESNERRKVAGGRGGGGGGEEEEERGKQPPATEKRHQMNNAVSTPTSNKTQDSRGRQSGDLTPSDKTTSFSTSSSSSSPTTPKQQRRRPPRDRGKSSAKHYGNGGKWASSSGGGSSISISSIWLLRTLSDKVLLMTVLVSALASALSSSAIVRAEGTKGGEKGIGPVFLEPVPNVTVAKGRDASLTCTVDHLGMHKVAWIHLDRQMILSIHNHIITRTPRFSVTHDSHKTWTLQVTAVEEEDRGHYMCQVNTKPMISQTGFLQVVVPPNIVDAMSSPSSIVVREKDEVTLSCHAEGFPEPQIKWKREDAQSIKTSDGRKVSQLDHPALPLGQVSRMDMGAYLCIASNGVPPSISKRITLDVEFSPQMHVPNQLVGAPLSTNVTLECFVEAHPRAITYWEFAGSMVMNTSRIATDTIEKLYRIHMLLIIRDLQESDFGTYKCISKNSIAETDGSITLNKTYRPTSPPQTMLHSSDVDSSASSGLPAIVWLGVLTSVTLVSVLV